MPDTGVDIGLAALYCSKTGYGNTRKNIEK